MTQKDKPHVDLVAIAEITVQIESASILELLVDATQLRRR
jgi:hypothetical protein